MTYSIPSPSHARRSGWERLIHANLTSCEITVCIGGVLLVGFIGAIAGLAF